MEKNSRILVEPGIFSEDDSDIWNSFHITSQFFKHTLGISLDNIINNHYVDSELKAINFYRCSFAMRSLLQRANISVENLDFFNCLNWVPVLRQYYVNQDYCFLDLKKITEFSTDIFPLYVRPCKGNKVMSGDLYPSKDVFNLNYNYYRQNQNINPYELCLMAKPKKIGLEFRHVFVNKQLISSCIYLENGERVDRKSHRVADELAVEISKNEYFLNKDNFVIDTCVDDTNNEYALLEINSIHHSSFYSCDLHAIYKELSNYYS